VIKAVAEARVATLEVERIGSVQAINPDDSLDEVEVAPTMFQRLVEKVADIRVTMVSQRVFAVAIRVPPGAPLDFRDTDPNACTYEIFDLRPDDIRRCVGFMEHYGLRFGAFDFALGQDGDLVFFECNPNGQWGWIEAHSGLPITAAVVDLLLDPSL
jgi:glutathione synthase/RimK-type ligase-like ATP-grasp enzyme